MTTTKPGTCPDCGKYSDQSCRDCGHCGCEGSCGCFSHAAIYRMIWPAFISEVRRLGGTDQGASDWLVVAIQTGLEATDTPESLAWLCVDDELSNLEYGDEYAARLRAALKGAQ